MKTRKHFSIFAFTALCAVLVAVAANTGMLNNIAEAAPNAISCITVGAGLKPAGQQCANFALKVAFGGNGSANTVARSDHNHLGQVWSGSLAKDGLFVTNSGGNGLHGLSSSTSGIGVSGESSKGNGILGTSASKNDSGIYGYNTNGGRGVWGYSPGGLGVEGQSNSSNGVLGTSASANDSGVYGYNTNGGRGVWGYSPGGLGVEGQSNSSNGVYGFSKSSSGSGVYGESVNGNGVKAKTSSYSAAAVHADNTGGGYGVWASSYSGPGIYAQSYGNVAGLFAGAVSVNGNLSVSGNLTVTGVKNAVVHTKEYGDRLLYAVESPENWFEDFGSGRLENGRAIIAVDPVFAQTVNLTEDYHVFLTPRDGYAALYATNLTPTSFEVRAVEPTANIAFSYRIIAKRSGFEDLRLASVNIPVPTGVISGMLHRR